MDRRRLYLGFALFWAVCAVLSTLSVQAMIAIGTMRVTGTAAAGRVMLGQVSPWIGVLVLTPAVILWATRFPFTRERWLRSALAHVLGVLVFAVAYAALAVAIALALVGRVPRLDDWRPILSRLAGNSMLILTKYSLIVGVTEGVRSRAEARDREIVAQKLAQTSAELERDLASARLLVLRQQLHPHFLFNTLNTIASLVEEDPASARRLITRLADLLRLSLHRGGAQQTTLGDELDFTDRYVAVEHVRLAERLRVRYDVPESALHAMVPGFLLQPLVENAIRHGIGKLPEGGDITIGAERSGSTLRLWVVNDAPPGAEPLSEGVGLGNTRARLASLYGGAARLDAQGRGGRFTVTLSFPFAAAAPAEVGCL